MSIFPTCKHEWTDPINSNCPQCETEEEIATLRARIAELGREHDEDQGVIRIWRGRTERAEAQRDRLREALERIEHKSQPMPREGHHFCPYRTALDAVNQSAKAALKEPA